MTSAAMAAIALLSEHELKQSFYAFVRTFQPPSTDVDTSIRQNAMTDEPQVPPYLARLRELFESHQGQDQSRVCSFPVDMNHLRLHSPALLRSLLAVPADALLFMDEALIDIVLEEFRDLGLTAEHIQRSGFAFRTSAFNHPRPRAMRDFDPQDIETLVAARGVVIRCSAILPDMRLAVFRCGNRNVVAQLDGEVECGHEEQSALVSGEVTEPSLCSKCNARHSFELAHSKCVYGSKQLLKIQEAPDVIPEGETPHTILAYVYDDLVDAVKPGDFVVVVGVHRAAPVRVLERAQTVRAVFRTFLDVNSVRREAGLRLQLAQSDLDGPGADATMGDEYDSETFTSHLLNGDRVPASLGNYGDDWSAAEISKMKGIGAHPDIYDILVRSLAPNVWETDDVKRGLLCQLFSATPKVVGDRAARSDIHILLCGDPSTAKSQLLKYVHGLTARGVYTCGRGSSAVGLTASVVRDAESKEFVLESGAIILSDKGICCIDEFDKMDETARTILHEVMEQQTVTIAKAGIVCSLNARAAILASANPIKSRYDPGRSVIENIALPASLMSRFDLIYLMLDQANPTLDAALAEHLCNLYSTGEEAAARLKPPLDRPTFAKYISYARRFCHPRLTDEAKTSIVDYYVALRKTGYATDPQEGGGEGGHSVNATPRQLESLIRLSEALAKMELNTEVTRKHVDEANRLMKIATYSALINPATGRIDFQQLTAGVSESARLRREKLEKILLGFLKDAVAGLDKESVSEKISNALRQENEQPLDLGGRELGTLLKELESYGKIKAAGGKFVFTT